MQPALIQRRELAPLPVVQPARPSILVAVADPEARRYVCLVLQWAGFDVVEAASGAEAVSFAAQRASFGKPVPLVIFDVPRRDASEALQAVAELRRQSPGTPVLLMASAPGRDLYREAMRLGVAAVLRRPVDRLELVLAVRVRLPE